MNNPNISELTIRDYFAAKAMQAWVTATACNEEAAKTFQKAGVNANNVEEFMSKLSYDMADSMLKVRDQTNS